MPLDGVFLKNLTNEISEKAIGARVEKVFEPSREEIVLLLRAPSFHGRLLLSARNGAARLGFIESAPENPKVAPMFCMLLRKYIGGAKITEVKSFGLERVVKIGFQARNEMGDEINPAIYLELITGAPNIIFTDENGKIVDSLRRSDVEKNVRMIQPGAIYTLPEGQNKLNLLEATVDEAIEKLELFKENKIWEALLSAFDGISPLIAREIAAYIEPDLDARLESAKPKMLKWGIERLKNAIENGTPHIIYKENGEPRDFSFMPISQYGEKSPSFMKESFSSALEEFYSERDSRERIRQQSQDILKLLTVLSSRISRKINYRKADLKKCEKKEECRIFGELIKANIYAISRGDSSAEVINYYDETGATIRIPLDVKLSPQENAQKYFKDYKKFCAAESMLEELLQNAEEELKYIESVFEALSRAETSEDLLSIRQELEKEGYIRASRGKQKAAASKPMRFILSSGAELLVGKNNTQNDELTLRTAGKNDIWFHTKNIHGSHAILFSESPTDEDIIESAEIAAYYSKAKDSSSVAVDYTPARYVKKPQGARPGMVIYTTNKTVYVTPSEESVKMKKG